ncbi:MAG: glycosyltransferase [Gammaproteobacteria bacterium]|nr:glycosyltransferase [Gammaproteobacteria bacterium]
MVAEDDLNRLSESVYQYIATPNDLTAAEVLQTCNSVSLDVRLRFTEVFMHVATIHKLELNTVYELIRRFDFVEQAFIQLLEERIHHQQTSSTQDLPKGISAVIRIQNEAQHIKDSILSIYRSVDEIIVALHNCTDDTESIIQKLIDSGLNKIRIIHYYEKIARAGHSYHQEREQGLGSLAQYYNFCFSHARYSDVLKWDGDMVAFPLLHQILINHNGQDANLIFEGCDIFDEKCSAGPEIRLYPNQVKSFYFDSLYFEVLYSPFPSLAVSQPMYIHMKFAKDQLYLPYLT